MTAVQVPAAVFDGLAGEDRMVLSYVLGRPVRFDPRGVAEVIGLTPAAVALAVGRLVQVGLLAGDRTAGYVLPTGAAVALAERRRRERELIASGRWPGGSVAPW